MWVYVRAVAEVCVRVHVHEPWLRVRACVRVICVLYLLRVIEYRY